MQDRGKAAFRRRFPDILAQLEGPCPKQMQAVERNGRVENIRIGAAQLYPKPGPENCREQVEEHLRDPDRLALMKFVDRVSIKKMRSLRRMAPRKVSQGGFSAAALPSLAPCVRGRGRGRVRGDP